MRKLLLILLILLVVSEADAQRRRRFPTAVASSPDIAFQQADSTIAYDVTSKTIVTNVGSGTNRYTVLAVGCYSTANHVTASIDGTGGGAMDSLSAATGYGVGLNQSLKLFGFKNAQSGSRTITITFYGASQNTAIGAVTLNNVDQTTPIGSKAANSASLSTGNATTTITNDAGNWVVSGVWNYENIPYTAAGTNQTIRVHENEYDQSRLCMSTKSATGTGESFTQTGGTGVWYFMASVEVNKAP